MSQIFEALQNSEAEARGEAVPAVVDVKTLLELAERRLASRQESGTQKALSEGIGDTEHPLEAVETENIIDSSQFERVVISPTPEDRLVCLTDKFELAAEAFRLLGVRLRHRRHQRPLATLLITSTIPQEGKSIVAANLACTLARTTDGRVLLIDGDLRRQTLSRMFRLGDREGLCDCILQDRAVISNIYFLENAGFWFEPTGRLPSDSLELLQSGKLNRLVEQFTAWFDWIIVDTPPVLPLADTSVWARLVDGILLVTRQGATSKKELLKGLEAFDHDKLVGVVVNGSTFVADNYYYRPALHGQSDASQTD